MIGKPRSSFVCSIRRFQDIWSIYTHWKVSEVLSLSAPISPVFGGFEYTEHVRHGGRINVALKTIKLGDLPRYKLVS